MSVEVIPSYRLALRHLQQFLKKKYPGQTVHVELKLDQYVLRLPAGCKFTEEDRDSILDLRDKEVQNVSDSSDGIAD